MTNDGFDAGLQSLVLQTTASRNHLKNSLTIALMCHSAALHTSRGVAALLIAIAQLAFYSCAAVATAATWLDLACALVLTKLMR